MHELISTLKKKGNGGEWTVELFPQILESQETATTTTKYNVQWTILYLPKMYFPFSLGALTKSHT